MSTLVWILWIILSSTIPFPSIVACYAEFICGTAAGCDTECWPLMPQQKSHLFLFPLFLRLCDGIFHMIFKACIISISNVNQWLCYSMLFPKHWVCSPSFDFFISLSWVFPCVIFFPVALDLELHFYTVSRLEQYHSRFGVDTIRCFIFCILIFLSATRWPY